MIFLQIAVVIILGIVIGNVVNFVLYKTKIATEEKMKNDPTFAAKRASKEEAKLNRRKESQRIYESDYTITYAFRILKNEFFTKY